MWPTPLAERSIQPRAETALRSRPGLTAIWPAPPRGPPARHGSANDVPEHGEQAPVPLDLERPEPPPPDVPARIVVAMVPATWPESGAAAIGGRGRRRRAAGRPGGNGREVAEQAHPGVVDVPEEASSSGSRHPHALPRLRTWSQSLAAAARAVQGMDTKSVVRGGAGGQGKRMVFPYITKERAECFLISTGASRATPFSHPRCRLRRSSPPACRAIGLAPRRAPMHSKREVRSSGPRPGRRGVGGPLQLLPRSLHTGPTSPTAGRSRTPPQRLARLPLRWRLSTNEAQRRRAGPVLASPT